MAQQSPSPVSARDVLDGEPTALAAVCQLRGPAVLAYCEQVCAQGPAAEASAEAFGRFRADAVAAEDPFRLDPDALLLSATRRAAARRAPRPPASPLRRLRGGTTPACKLAPELLVARAEGTLSDADRVRLARHLERCAACRAASERFATAERAYRNPPDARVSAPVAATIVAALVAAAPVADQSDPAAPTPAASNGNGDAPEDRQEPGDQAPGPPAAPPRPPPTSPPEPPRDGPPPQTHEDAWEAIDEPDPPEQPAEAPHELASGDAEPGEPTPEPRPVDRSDLTEHARADVAVTDSPTQLHATAVDPWPEPEPIAGAATAAGTSTPAAREEPEPEERSDAKRRPRAPRGLARTRRPLAAPLPTAAAGRIISILERVVLPAAVILAAAVAAVVFAGVFG